jgi:hypothetical protein
LGKGRKGLSPPPPRSQLFCLYASEIVYGRTNKQTGGQTDEQTNGWTDGQSDRQVDKQPFGQTNRHAAERHTVGLMNRQMNRQTDRRMT